MPAPAVVARQAPSGTKLLNGYRTTVAFSLLPNVCVWEKSVKPPTPDMGEMIDVTDMFNNLERTQAFRALRKWSAGEHKCAYDPDVYNKIKNTLIGKNGTVCVHFPDTSTLSFFGGVKSISADALEEGKQPEMTLMYEATNMEPVTGIEFSPVMVPFAGT